MRNLKKTMALLLSLVMVGSVFAGCSDKDSSTDGTTTAKTTAGGTTAATEAVTAPAPNPNSDKVLTVYAWNDEFQNMLNDYYLKDNPLPAGYTLDFVINPSQDGVYQQALDQALESKAKIDIFLIEADYALKYVNSKYTVDIATVGISEADMANQYQYTRDIVTVDGVQKGTSWQAAPGLFTYRRSIAKEVFGTDDPAVIQEKLSTWEKFDAAAVEVAKSGKYVMLAGYDDSYRTFSNNMTAPWVTDKVINIDNAILDWVDQTKNFTDKGYNNKAILWDANWAKGQTSAGNVFGYFLSTWGFPFVLQGNSLDVTVDDGGKLEVGNGIYGDWAACLGPQSYYWGGTWICASAEADDLDLVYDIMQYFTCNTDTMAKFAKGSNDFVNNKVSIEQVIAGGYKSELLGGQDHYSLLSEAASKIVMDKTTPYDQLLNERMQAAMHDYFSGAVATKEEALEVFYTSISEIYPDLTRG